MKKVILVVLIMVSTIIPQGNNISLYLRGFSSTDCGMTRCFYKAFIWSKAIEVSGECPYSISYNRETGGWTR